MAFLQLGDSGDNARILLTDEITYLIEQDGSLIKSVSQLDVAQAALLRTTRGLVLLDYTGYKTFINGLRVADCRRVREGDVIQIGQVLATLFEIEVVIVKKDSDLVNPLVKCDVDLRGFTVGDEVVYCPACDKPHHADCWTFNGESCSVCAYQAFRKLQSGWRKGERDHSLPPSEPVLENAEIEIYILGWDELRSSEILSSRELDELSSDIAR